MESSCIQDIADGGMEAKDEEAEISKVTFLVSANDVSGDEFYGSKGNKYKNYVKELNKSSGVFQLGNATVQTVQDVEKVKQIVQNVKLYPRQAIIVQAVANMDAINETAEKLVDLRVSEGDRGELSALTEYSVKDVIPEVLVLENEDEPVPEGENESGVHNRQNLSTVMDIAVKREGLRPKSGKKRRKIASNDESLSRSVSRSVTSTQPSCEKLLKVRDAVERAIREHKTFTVQGTFPTIREAMRQRGWIEKETTRNKTAIPLDDASIPSSISLLASLTQTDGRTTEALFIARLLRNVNVDFLWTMRSEPIDWQAVQRKQIVNRFPRAYFTTKVGLCACLQHMHWFCENDVSHILFPRCYNVCQPDELTAFTHDFRITACLGLLKWLVSKYEKQGESSLKSVEGKIPFTAVEFALKRCQEYIGVQTHEDIDRPDPISIWDHQWDQFLTWYYLAVHDNFLLSECRTASVVDLYESAKHVLLDIRKFWPQIDLDGMNNIWIVKPSAQSRGRGIQLINKLDTVMDKVNPAAMKESRYVVQKYIERPLLIYDTKFDIRQWFLVTSAQPLTIWMYKESYLRFCSQQFDLINMHESVHLCNNAVQCKYKNGKRNPLLPDENMWDCYTFQTYLRGIGHADMWHKCIYPGMRQSIICALLASQEHMDRRRNCFELFGADFMLSEDFSPWLIEINSCPCMQSTTSVTARMCSQCLEDVIKVVVDKRFDRRASTGMFELIYRQHISQAPPYLGMSLSVRGTKVHHTVPIPRSRTRSGTTVKKPRDDSEEQESHSSGPDSSKKRKSVMVQSSFSSGPMMKNSSGNSGENRCDDCTENIVTQNKSGISFESEELFSQVSEQLVSKGNVLVIHSEDSFDKQDIISSDSKHTAKVNSSVNNSQLKDPEFVNSVPYDTLDRNHSSEELEFLDNDFETTVENNPNICIKSSTNLASVSCEDEKIQENGPNYKEQGLSSSASKCMMKKAVRSKISERHQLISSSPENMLQMKKAEDSSDEGESSSSGPESNMQKNRESIRVKNFKPGCMEHGAVRNGPDTTAQKYTTVIIRKSRSTSTEQESVRSSLEQIARRNPRLKNSGSSGTEMTLTKKKNCKVKKMSESWNEQHPLNSGFEGTFETKKNTRMKNLRNSSGEHISTNNWPENIRERKRSATRKIIRNSSEEQELFDDDVEDTAQKKISYKIKKYDNSEQQEHFSNESENKAYKNYSRIKHLRENSEDQELSSESESPSQKKRKNSWEKNSGDRSGTEKQCNRTNQSTNKSTEKGEVSNSSNMQKKIENTAEYIRSTSVDFTEDLTHQLNKTQKSKRKNDKTAVCVTTEHKEEEPNNKSSPISSTVIHDKGSQIQKGAHTVFLQDEAKAEMQGSNVMDVQETEGIPTNKTSVMQGEIDDEAAKAAGKSWSYPKESLSISHFTEAIYQNVEEVTVKQNKPFSSGWKNSNDAEKSMKFFKEWRQKLDYTKATCEDMLAKLKMGRDNENIINKPKYYSIDKGINWEDGSANKPTISDIIKKLSQTQPEREFFMCNIGRRFIDTIPQHTSKRKEEIKIKQCDLSMVTEDKMKSVAKHNQGLSSEPSDQKLSITPHVYSPSINRNPVSLAMRGILPHIKQRIKEPSPNSLFRSDRKMDNFYAVGISLKTLQASHNLKKHFLLPLGSDQCLGVNSTTATPMEGSLL